MFHFAGLSSITYVFSYGYTDMTLYGFPHSDTFGSLPACGSPKLFAAYRVLHRLLAPRHPPYALPNLTISACPRYLREREQTRFPRRCSHRLFLFVLYLCSMLFSKILLPARSLARSLACISEAKPRDTE